MRCFSVVSRRLQHPHPASDPAAPSSPAHAREIYAQPPQVGGYLVVSCHGKTWWTARAGDFGASSVQNHFEKALYAWLSRLRLLARIALSALLAPKNGTGTGLQRLPRGGEGMPTGMRARPSPGPPPPRRRRAPRFSHLVWLRRGKLPFVIRFERNSSFFTEIQICLIRTSCSLLG
jgi:hypothetical protein